DAHRFAHLAKKYGLGAEAEESLFKAYFTDGKNTSDHDTLIQLGVDIGLSSDSVVQMLNSNDYADEVDNDIREAQEIGVRGVPFFVFDRKFAFSGAQSVELFL